MNWALSHIIGGNVNSYPVFPSAYGEGVGKAALIIWLKSGGSEATLSLIQAPNWRMKLPSEKRSIHDEKG